MSTRKYEHILMLNIKHIQIVDSYSLFPTAIIFLKKVLLMYSCFPTIFEKSCITLLCILLFSILVNRTYSMAEQLIVWNMVCKKLESSGFQHIELGLTVLSCEILSLRHMLSKNGRNLNCENYVFGIYMIFPKYMLRLMFTV